jgi:hypothetical protein
MSILDLLAREQQYDSSQNVIDAKFTTTRVADQVLNCSVNTLCALRFRKRYRPVVSNQT